MGRHKNTNIQTYTYYYASTMHMLDFKEREKKYKSNHYLKRIGTWMITNGEILKFYLHTHTVFEYYTIKTYLHVI